MNITNIETELRKVQALVTRWAEQGYVPQIEKNIALQRVQKFYELFLEVETQPQIPSSHEPIVTPEPTTAPPVVDNEPANEPRRERDMEDADVVEYVEVKRAAPAEAQPQEPTFRMFGVEISTEVKERFTRDLFCNDHLVFHNEIQKMERMASLDDVLIYMSERYEWAESNPSAQEFTDIVLSRF